ncbi:MAG TPA: YXWGXW repeat-containing protein [Roseiarcus sp.]|nr:YXWGXW repeat-containing protein [Roseiarcus sp.]
MLRLTRLFLCVSVAALILGAAPDVEFAFVAPAHAQAEVVSIASIAPPPLPAYSQPPLPGPGYTWIPGAWAWDSQGYYWVPGYWATPPATDLMWTPGYWGWDKTNNDYVHHAGYNGGRAGPTVRPTPAARSISTSRTGRPRRPAPSRTSLSIPWPPAARQ